MQEGSDSYLTRRKFMVMSGAGLAASVCPAWANERHSPKRIVFITGRSSHAYGHHEHAAGCRFLANCLNALPNIKAEVIADQWPVDNAVFDGVYAVVRAGGGKTALHYAKKSNNIESIDLFKKRGAKE